MKIAPTLNGSEGSAHSPNPTPQSAPIIVHIVEGGLITWIGTMPHVEPTRRTLMICMKEAGK